MSVVYYIGWDVGAWNCTKNSKSCDALVILNEDGQLEGTFRGSLGDILRNAQRAEDLLMLFLKLCKLDYKKEKVVMAIDTPLGYSQSFMELITQYNTSDLKSTEYIDNPYLFRKTEKHIFEAKIKRENGKNIRPLSAVNDMIGSQSTKGIHFLSKFAPLISETGVWKSKDENLTVFETYPAVNREIEIPQELSAENDDIKDAYICARIAYQFDKFKHKLVPPDDDVIDKEGWIWYLNKKGF